MTPRHFALLGVLLALAGCTTADTADKPTGVSTTTSTRGSSSATITQDGGSSAMTRRVIRRGPNSQTITQEQGGNRTTIRQSVEEDDTEELDELEGDDW
jgi:hypothetical protein